MFGRAENTTRIQGNKDAFVSAFSHERNKAAWAAVGAAPITMIFLGHNMVHHDLEDDPNHIMSFLCTAPMPQRFLYQQQRP